MKIQKLVLVVTALSFTLNSVTVAMNASPQSQPPASEPPASEPPASEPAPTQTPPAPDSSAANIPMLRAQARQAMSRSQWASAADLWSAITVQVPGDAEATKGLSDAQAALNQGSSIDKVAGDAAVEREQAQVEFDNALVRSGESFSRGDYSGAERIATQAKMSLQRNKALLSPADFDAKMASVEAELVKINSAKTQNVEAAKAIQASDASKSTLTQNRQELEQRQRTINENMVRVRQLQSELKYKEALEVVDEILFIDPTNPSALAMRDVLQTGILYRRYSELQRSRSFAFSEFAVDAQASFIPPKINLSGPGPRSLDAEMTYPEDWPALSVRREGAYAASGFRDSEIDQKAIARMEQKSTLDFQESETLTFGDFIKFIQDETKLVFFVDKRSLLAADPSLEMSSDIEANIPSGVSWAIVLDMVLRSTEDGGGSRDGADNRPDWMIENGMVVIASATELALRRVTIVYDIRDLLYQVPYFNNAPDFAIDAALNQGGGGGGGGGGGSLFGAAGDSGIEDLRREILERLKQLIKFLVPEAQWDAGNLSESRLDDFSGNLIVTATPKTHREIMNLLSQLRAVRAIQINIESRLIAVEVQWFEQIGLDFDLYFNANPGMYDSAIDQDPNFQLRDFFFQDTRTNSGRAGRLKNPLTFGGLGQTDATAVTQGVNTIATGSALGTPGIGSNIAYQQTGIYEPLGVRRNGQAYPNGEQSNGMSPVQVQQEGLPLIQALGAGLKGTVAAASLANPALTVGFTYLDDVQVDLLVLATQADQRAMTLTAPRLTLFNGTRSWISFGGSQAYVASVTASTGDSSGAFIPQVANLLTGFVLDIEAVTSSDRRYVSMTVQFAQNILIGFTSQEVQGAAGGGDFGRSSQFNATIQLPNVAVTQINTAVSCPDKGTILLGGRRDVNETEIEVGVPVLSKVPFVNRFFTNSVTSKLETTTLLLIRPEIIIQAEAEDLLFPGLSDQLSGSSKGAGY